MHRTSTVLAKALALACAWSFFAGPVRAQTAYEPTQVEALAAMDAHYADGHIREAIAVVESYLEANPCDPRMHFNLACFEALSGKADEAAESLERAFALGYVPLERVHLDQDLSLLHASGTSDSLVTLYEELRLEARRAASLDLFEGEWTEPIALRAAHPDCHDAPADVNVRLRSTPEALDVEFVFDGRDVSELEAQIVVGVPLELESRRTERARVFRGRADDSLGLFRWNGRAVPEGTATTQVSVEGRRVRQSIRWNDLEGLGPPLDPVVAFNVRVVDLEDPRRAVALVPDPYVGSSRVFRRFHADLSIYPNEPPAPWLRGRLASNYVIGDSLSVDLVAQGLPGGDARIEWRVVERDAPEVVVAERTDRRQIESEIAFLPGMIGVEGIGDGAFELQARLEVGGSVHGPWAVEFVHLETDWFLRGRRIAEALSADDRGAMELVLFRGLNLARGANADDPVEWLLPYVEQVDAISARVEAGEPAYPVGTDASWREVAIPLNERSLTVARVHRPGHDDGAADGPGVVFFATMADASAFVDPTSPGRSMLPASSARWLVEATIEVGAPLDAQRDWVKTFVTWSHGIDDGDVDVIAANADAASDVARAVLGAGSGVETLRLVVDARFDPWPDELPESLEGSPRIEIASTVALPLRVQAVVGGLRDVGYEVDERRLHGEDEVRRFLAGVDQRASQ